MDKYVTADGTEITDGLVVWDYDMDLSRVSFADTTGMYYSCGSRNDEG